MFTFWYKKLDGTVLVPIDSQSTAKQRLHALGTTGCEMASTSGELNIAKSGDGWP